MADENVVQREVSSILVGSKYALVEAIDAATGTLENDNVATSIIQILTGQNTADDQANAWHMVKWSLKKALKAGSEDFFRGSSLPIRLIVAYLHAVGDQYRTTLLEPLVQKVYNNKKPTEINPAVVRDEKQYKTNMATLKSLAEMFFDAIAGSAKKMPQDMLDLFQLIDMHSQSIFGGKASPRQTLSPLLITRFLLPGVTTPHKNKVIKTKPNEDQQRTLLLISKLIQSSVSSGEILVKERYMEPLMMSLESKQRPLDLFFNSICSGSIKGVVTGKLTHTFTDEELKPAYGHLYAVVDENIGGLIASLEATRRSHGLDTEEYVMGLVDVLDDAGVVPERKKRAVSMALSSASRHSGLLESPFALSTPRRRSKSSGGGGRKRTNKR